MRHDRAALHNRWRCNERRRIREANPRIISDNGSQLPPGVSELNLPLCSRASASANPTMSSCFGVRSSPSIIGEPVCPWTTNIVCHFAIAQDFTKLLPIFDVKFFMETKEETDTSGPETD